MSSMSGIRARPFSVSAYSTRGGTAGYVARSTMPSSSSARRRSERVRGLMPARERSSSQKREQPSARSRTSRRVHLPQTTSAVRQTGHVGSPATPNTLPNEVWSAVEQVAQGAPGARAASVARLDATLGRLDEHPALAAEGDLERLA